MTIDPPTYVEAAETAADPELPDKPDTPRARSEQGAVAGMRVPLPGPPTKTDQNQPDMVPLYGTHHVKQTTPMRDRPRVASRQIAEVPIGAIVETHGVLRGWLYVTHRAPNGERRTGWILVRATR